MPMQEARHVRTMIPPKVLQRHCSADPKWLASDSLKTGLSQNGTGIYISGSMCFFILRSAPLFAVHALSASHKIRKLS